jgi:hypothetical protein
MQAVADGVQVSGAEGTHAGCIRKFPHTDAAPHGISNMHGHDHLGTVWLNLDNHNRILRCVV